MFFICCDYNSIDYWILCKFRNTESLAIPMGVKQENGNLGKIVPVTDQVSFDMECVCEGNYRQANGILGKQLNQITREMKLNCR